MVVQTVTARIHVNNTLFQEIVRSCFMSVCRSLQKTLLQNEEDKNRLSSSEDDDGTTHRTADSEKAQSVGGGEGETSLTPTDVGEVYF